MNNPFASIDARLSNIETWLLDLKHGAPADTPPAAPKDVLTIDELAHFTGLSKSTLYKMTIARQIPYYKPNGRLIYFKREEILAWMQQGKVDIINKSSWFWNEKFQIVLHLAIDVISMFLTTVV
jgi:excisionase family DNA binding protein